MSANYKRLLLILEKWPIDKSKPGRDLGEYLRSRAKKLLTVEFQQTTSSSEKRQSRQLDALQRLTTDCHNQKYPRRYQSSATGLNKDQATQALSSDFLNYIASEEKGIFDKSAEK